VKMHHLTPNAIVQLSKFFWAVRTFGGPISSDAFCRLYELHPQGRKISFEGENQVYIAQSGCCTFVPRRNNKTLRIERVELSYCHKNKWEDDWVQYWFYAKIDFSGTSSSSGVSHPLASKVLTFEHVNQPDFKRFVPGFKDCCDAFAAAARLISGCDLIEEYLAVKVWSLTSN